MHLQRLHIRDQFTEAKSQINGRFATVRMMNGNRSCSSSPVLETGEVGLSASNSELETGPKPPDSPASEGLPSGQSEFVYCHILNTGMESLKILQISPPLAPIQVTFKEVAVVKNPKTFFLHNTFLMFLIGQWSPPDVTQQTPVALQLRILKFPSGFFFSSYLPHHKPVFHTAFPHSPLGIALRRCPTPP